MATLAAGVLLAHAAPVNAVPRELPSLTPEEALWYAVTHDMAQYADSLKQRRTPGTRKANLYQAKYIENILNRPTTRAGVLETAGTICAMFDEAAGAAGALRAAGQYLTSVPATSLFPGYFPRSNAGLREEADTLLRRSAGLNAGLLCADHAEDVEVMVGLWKGAAWSGSVAKRIAREVSLNIRRNVSKGIVDEKTKTLLAKALDKACGGAVQTGDAVTCNAPGAPDGLYYSYGAVERREVGIHHHAGKGLRCSAFVTLVARPGKKPAVLYGNVSCYEQQN